MTMINFKRMGGVTGKEIAMDFDLASMPADESQRLQNLLLDSNFFDIPVVNDLRSGPDEYEYALTVVAGNAIHTVRVSDTSMPHTLRPLIEELTELTKATT
ncbi:MAG TPA: protealysin inhibitor emfourin [Anaerolineales bacterium]|nr:protealysin inhibitor emfourin [Anaerolineales bacterium]